MHQPNFSLCLTKNERDCRKHIGAKVDKAVITVLHILMMHKDKPQRMLER